MQLKKQISYYLVFYVIPFFLLGTNELIAQDYLANVKFYNYENGLAGRFANCTFEDSRGLIWIGTQFGLNRFDVRDFITFNEASGLPFNQVMEIHEDSEGWLWLFRSCKEKRSCTRNLAFLHSITLEILTFEERFGEEIDFDPKEIVSIATNEKREVFLTGNKMVLHWKEGEIVQKLNLDHWEKTPSLLSVLEDEKLAGWFQLKDENGKSSIQYRVFDMAGNIHQDQLPLSSGKDNFFNLKLIGKDYLGQKIIDNGWYIHPNRPNFILNDDGNLAIDTTNWTDFSKSNSYGYNPNRPEVWRIGNMEGGFDVYAPYKGLIYSFGSEFPEFRKPLFNRHIRFGDKDVTWLAGRYGVFRIRLKPNLFQRILFNPLTDLESPHKHISMGVIPFEEGTIMMLTQSGNFFELIDNKPVPNTKLKTKVNMNTMTLIKGYSDKWWAAGRHYLKGVKKTGEEYEVEEIPHSK